jgi:hypothetical protein
VNRGSWRREEVKKTAVAKHVASGGSPEDVLAGRAALRGGGGEDLGDCVVERSERKEVSMREVEARSERAMK